VSTLFEKPPEDTAVPRIIGGGVIAFATMAVLSLMWWTLSPFLGRVYTGVRLAESLILWKFTGWGSYFTSVPAGQPFVFLSIYKSSVGFGLVATALTVLIGFFAWRKRSREHIEVVNTAPSKKYGMAEIGGGAKRWARPSKEAEGEEVGAGAGGVASTANPFTQVRDLRDLRALETVADRVPWQLSGALALVMDSCAPLADEKARQAVLAAVSKASAHTVANKGAEPPAAIVTALRSHMVLAIADMRSRDAKSLDRLHKMIIKSGHLPTAIGELAKDAQAGDKLRFPDYAWLRPVDTTLHTAICSF
jgi:hypothetical protein